MTVPVIDRLVARGAVRLDVPLLQPAEPFLELAGEDLRRRVFLSEDERGRVRCLRPELTIPAAREYIRREAPSPARYALAGTVFRQRDGSDEFPQCGIEAIGGDAAEGDARAIAEAVALVDELAPGRRAEVIVGDRAIYAAALGAIGLSEGWVARLVRVHGDANGLAAVLNDGPVEDSAPEAALGASSALPGPVRDALERGDRDALEGAVADAIADARMGKGARGAREIADRLLDHHAPIGSDPTPEQRETLLRLMSLCAPLEEAAVALSSLGLRSDAFGRAAAHHAARLTELRQHDVDPRTLVFQTALGRSLDYYTGLVFEVRDAAGTVLAAGGRYDRLLGLLGGTDEPAVGFALWLDRLGVDLDGRAR